MVRIEYLDNLISADAKQYFCPSKRGDRGARGVTFWGDGTQLTIPHNTGSGNGKLTYSFSPSLDLPADLNGYGVDNVAFLLEKVSTASNSSNDDVKLRIYLNDSWMHDEYHSKIANHDFWLGIDLGADAHYNDMGYNNTGRNWVTIENWGDVDVTVKSCSVYRVYAMKDCPIWEEEEQELESEEEHLPNVVTEIADPETLVDMDNSIQKFPCAPGKNGRGYTFWKDENIITIAPYPNDYVEYKFNPHLDNVQIDDNYLGPYSCCILLDKIRLSSSTTSSDVPIRLKLNGTEIHTEYHSKVSPNHDIWIGLMPVGGGLYNDDAENTLRVENLGSVNVQVGTCFIYRTYQTKTK